MVNAKEILNIVEREEKRKEGFKRLFYPSLYNLELADKNITKCLKELK